MAKDDMQDRGWLRRIASEDAKEVRSWPDWRARDKPGQIVRVREKPLKRARLVQSAPAKR